MKATSILHLTHKAESTSVCLCVWNLAEWNVENVFDAWLMKDNNVVLTDQTEAVRSVKTNYETLPYLQSNLDNMADTCDKKVIQDHSNFGNIS